MALRSFAFKPLKRKLDDLYEYRSGLVHGGLEVYHPLQFEVLDPWVEKKYHRLMDVIDFGFAILLITLQTIIAKGLASTEVYIRWRSQTIPDRTHTTSVVTATARAWPRSRRDKARATVDLPRSSHAEHFMSLPTDGTGVLPYSDLQRLTSDRTTWPTRDHSSSWRIECKEASSSRRSMMLPAAL